MSLRKTWTVLDVWSQYKWEGEKAEVAGTKHSRAATVTAALAHGICSASENHEIFRSEHRYDLHMPPSGSPPRLAAENGGTASFSEQATRHPASTHQCSVSTAPGTHKQPRTAHATTTHSPTHERAQRSRLNTRPARMPTNLGR